MLLVAIPGLQPHWGLQLLCSLTASLPFSPVQRLHLYEVGLAAPWGGKVSFVSSADIHVVLLLPSTGLAPQRWRTRQALGS